MKQHVCSRSRTGKMEITQPKDGRLMPAIGDPIFHVEVEYCECGNGKYLWDTAKLVRRVELMDMGNYCTDCAKASEYGGQHAH